MAWGEIGETTLPQARALLAEFHEVDGSREVTKTIVDVVTALCGGKPAAKAPAPAVQTEEAGAEVMVGELFDAVKNRMLAEGWTPPSS